MKIMNFVFGVGIAVIIFIVALLGIQAFYPEPKYENYCKTDYTYAVPVMSTVYDCPGNITVTDCIQLLKENEVNSKEYKERENEIQECSRRYDDASRSYNKTFFIIASILGLIAIIVSFFLLGIINISAGVASAGIVLIIVSFTRGWNSTNDMLKFVVGLIIAIVIVFLTLKINTIFSDDKERKNKTNKK